MPFAFSGSDRMLKVKNIEIVYHDVVLAVRGVSLEVPQKKIVALLGSNGAGKSTTLTAISNILEIEDGEIEEGLIEFKGQRIDHVGPEAVVRMGILQVPEGRGIFDDLTVLENLKMGFFTRSDPGAAKSDLETVFGYFPVLRERQQQTAGYLNGGEQQMLAIGRALLARPKVLTLDEPSLGLAPLIIREIFRIIQRIKEKGETAILLVEQNAEMALSIAHHGFVLETGRITLHGSASVLLSSETIRLAYLGA
jgi:branched-chain amino acid transport system ATP-binding protein